jgi:predicted type IV restriction endonuclease
MADRQTESLASTVATVRSAIGRFSSNKGFNEQNTKASLIVPILQALGWDTGDADEVHWEYRRKPKSDPVDFALLLQRAPCLFLEAKALRESLEDHRMVKQVLGYAVEAGV